MELMSGESNRLAAASRATLRRAGAAGVAGAAGFMNELASVHAVPASSASAPRPEMIERITASPVDESGVVRRLDWPGMSGRDML
jgi:hypothetical protein